MSELLPGAEFAPVEFLSTVTGGRRRATVLEVATLGDNPIAYIHAKAASGVIRRLSCTDPCDQREIWRLAAMALGQVEDVAVDALLSEERGGYVLTDGRVMWVLRAGRSSLETLWLHEEVRHRAGATAALCARVWGPK